MQYRIGDQHPAWPAEFGVIMEIRPYTGKYTESYNVVLRVSANTDRGWAEFCEWDDELD